MQIKEKEKENEYEEKTDAQTCVCSGTDNGSRFILQAAEVLLPRRVKAPPLKRRKPKPESPRKLERLRTAAPLQRIR